MADLLHIRHDDYVTDEARLLDLIYTELREIRRLLAKLAGEG